MTVKELIEHLKTYDENLEIRCIDIDDNRFDLGIENIREGHYNKRDWKKEFIEKKSYGPQKIKCIVADCYKLPEE